MRVLFEISLFVLADAVQILNNLYKKETMSSIEGRFSGETSRLSILRERLERLPYGPKTLAWFFGILSFIVRVPFLFRWDLQLNGDTALCYLMTLRISHGDHPLYLYGQDYQGTAEYYLAGFLHALFGPSFPLYGAVGLLEWSLATAVCVFLLIQGTDKFHGIIGGIIIVVGVPFSLYQLFILAYPLALLWAMLVLLVAYLLLTKGFSTGRFLILGLIIGTGMYLAKQFLPAMPAAFLACILFNSRKYRPYQYLKFGFVLGLGCLIGYLPELLYRVGHPHYRSFLGIASPMTLIYNLHVIFKSIPVYFDAQYFSRTPAIGQFTSSYYIYPRSFMDISFSILGGLVVFLILKSVFTSVYRKNLPLFLLSTLVGMNLLAILSSQVTNGLFWETRRYLIVSSIVFSAFLGVFFAELMIKRKVFWPLASVMLMTVFLGRVIAHEWDLLTGPEQKLVSQMKQAINYMDEIGVNRGLADWGEAYSITSMTNERIIMATRQWGKLDSNIELIPQYREEVSSSRKICLVDNEGTPVKDVINFWGTSFHTVSATRYLGGYKCTCYERNP